MTLAVGGALNTYTTTQVFAVVFSEREKQLRVIGFKVKLIVLQRSFVGLTWIGTVIWQSDTDRKFSFYLSQLIYFET